MPSVSIILPLYKQSKQVAQLQDIYSKIQMTHSDVVEVIFAVNNGDQETFDAFKPLENDFFKILFLSDGGWGKGLKEGVNSAKGDWVLYTNSARTHFEELNAFLNKCELKENRCYKARRQTRGVLRKFMSKLFEVEFALFSGKYQSDINGTPKLLSKSDFESLDLKDDGVFIDSELCFKLRKRGQEFTDFPFFNYERLEGKSTTNIKMAISFLLKLPGKLSGWK